MIQSKDKILFDFFIFFLYFFASLLLYFSASLLLASLLLYSQYLTLDVSDSQTRTSLIRSGLIASLK